MVGSSYEVKRSDKHLHWLRDAPYRKGFLEQTKTDIVIAEFPSMVAAHESFTLPDQEIEAGRDIEIVVATLKFRLL